MNYVHKRVVSGIRPTGYVHIGNYFGVIKNWIQIQYKYDCFFFIADWHALTTHCIKSIIISNISKKMFLECLSLGLNPNICTIFFQSKVNKIPKLYLILSMITSLHYLEKLPYYKQRDKSITYGLLGYPLLQCADILAYRAHIVPIGNDQIMNIELSQKIIKKINFINENKKYCTRLIKPVGLLNNVSHIIGTDGKKMSKSYNNTIFTIEEPLFLNFKINKIITSRNDNMMIRNLYICIIWKFQKIYHMTNIKYWIQYGCINLYLNCFSCKKIIINKILERQKFITENSKQNNMSYKVMKDILFVGQKRANKEIIKTLKYINLYLL